MELRGEESRRAVVTMEMIFTDHYLAPTLHGLPYYNKPPVFNWVVWASSRLVGGYNG